MLSVRTPTHFLVTGTETLPLTVFVMVKPSLAVPEIPVVYPLTFTSLTVYAFRHLPHPCPFSQRNKKSL